MAFNFYVMMISIDVMFPRFPKRISNEMMFVSRNVNPNQEDHFAK